MERGPKNNQLDFSGDSITIRITIDIQDFLKDFYPAPGRGRGFVFARFLSQFVSLSVSLSATLRENGWTDLHEIFILDTDFHVTQYRFHHGRQIDDKNF